jgi:cytochrome P450
MQPLLLRDGTRLSTGTRVAFASADILMDPSVTPNPRTSDPMRSYRKRRGQEEGHRHLFGQTDKDHLMFGHGKQACPGRLFAFAEIKMILARFLLDWEFEYPQEKSRPTNFLLDEMVFPDPPGKLMIKERVRN